MQGKEGLTPQILLSNVIAITVNAFLILWV